MIDDAFFLHRHAAAATRPVATPAFSHDGRGSRDQASAHGDRRRVDAYVVDEREEEEEEEGVDVTRRWCKALGHL